jgi:hypothetical protein
MCVGLGLNWHNGYLQTVVVEFSSTIA